MISEITQTQETYYSSPNEEDRLVSLVTYERTKEAAMAVEYNVW